MLKYIAAIFVTVIYLAGASLQAAETTPDDPQQSGEKEDHKLPRFVTFRAPAANLRTGPGKRYPIDWVIAAKGWPVEVIAEVDQWRKVRDWDGDTGWVNRIMLSGKRSVLVKTDNAKLRDDPGDNARAIATIKTHAHGQIKTCAKDWCKIDFGSESGWLPVKDLWGVYAGETLD